MFEITTTQLAFAAFLLNQGAELKTVVGSCFTVTSDSDSDRWNSRWINSAEYRFNAHLIHLQSLRRGQTRQGDLCRLTESSES